MSIRNLARPEVQAFKPYLSARAEATVQAVMLNANESPWPPPGDGGLNRYPDPQPAALRNRLAAIYGVATNQVWVGRGSDEAIDLLLRAFCRPGRDAVVLCPPTFGMYAVAARLQGAAIHEVPLVGARFELDADAVLAACDATVKLVFVCTPNNPTGTVVPLETITRLATALHGRALVIVDEAYIEFSGLPSASTVLDGHENLGVLRTLSKAWSLAGARVGSLLAGREIVDLLRTIMAPYPLSQPSVDAALAALDRDGEALMHRHVATLVGERGRVFAALVTLPGVRKVLDSRANFLAVRLDDADGVYRALAAKGIVVRNITRYPGLADALRISIGTPTENDRLLAALRGILAGGGA